MIYVFCINSDYGIWLSMQLEYSNKFETIW